MDGWQASGGVPSQAMFRAASLATSRLQLPRHQVATAMLQLLRETVEVGSL
jgi:hypothetical protein